MNIMLRTTVIDQSDCWTSAELSSAVINLGMGLDLERRVRVKLIEKTLSDGSLVREICIAVLA